MAPERTLQTKGRGDGVAKETFFLAKMAFSGNINCHILHLDSELLFASDVFSPSVGFEANLSLLF